ncbi:HAD family hydrolase [Paracoccus onubensis]|uniref:sulfotransferase-like domain-containing protein n=1 Tax=Paracoccus onubensis TaxID=1675788 RepID=UPI002730747C|nr:HAD family hydrolase [Paracoccus onubensis]MDP0929803.1 HAD family hydrolase [Paracoccus onubensis]
MTKPHRIAMWSGPRNLSTAMMRSFGARGDCACVDEPFYAHYLIRTGLPHPVRDKVIASQPADWREVLPGLTTEPCGQPIQYQKHMVQHMLPDMDLGWTAAMTNVFLIREPERVAASFAAKRGLPDPDELGFDRQWEMFQEMAARGPVPLVIDSADIRRAPAPALKALCDGIGIVFRESMLSWQPGPHSEDGVWGEVWYDAVNRSTGFAGAEGALPELGGDLARLADKLRPAYEKIAAHRLAIR